MAKQSRGNMDINEERDWRSKKQIDLELHNDGRNTPQIILKYKVKKLPDTKKEVGEVPRTHWIQGTSI